MPPPGAHLLAWTARILLEVELFAVLLYHVVQFNPRSLLHSFNHVLYLLHFPISLSLVVFGVLQFSLSLFFTLFQFLLQFLKLLFAFVHHFVHGHLRKQVVVDIEFVV